MMAARWAEKGRKVRRHAGFVHGFCRWKALDQIGSFLRKGTVFFKPERRVAPPAAAMVKRDLAESSPAEAPCNARLPSAAPEFWPVDRRLLQGKSRTMPRAWSLADLGERQIRNAEAGLLSVRVTRCLVRFAPCRKLRLFRVGDRATLPASRPTSLEAKTQRPTPH